MIYTPATVAALKLCYEAHKGQVDKAGVPYVFHPVHVAEQIDPNDPHAEELICIALLHDVVEDSCYTFDDLEKMGFAGSVVEALRLMTHDPKISYMDYVKNLSSNPLARKVKMEDLKHNMDRTRIRTVTEPDEQRIKKYQEAYSYLENCAVSSKED